MRVLVTGATGCLGRNLVAHLQEQGHRVTATGRNVHIGQALTQTGVTFHAADLENEIGLEHLFAEQEVVFHSAALSSPWGKYQEFYRANVVATKNVAKQCLQHRVKRLIHVSTPSIYFNFTDRSLIKEEDPLPKVPANHYVRTKLMAEQVVDDALQKGLEVITLRPRAIFGPHDTALMPRLIHACTKGKLPLVAGGVNQVDVTFVGNVVEALIAAMQAGTEAVGHPYNITNGQPIVLKELLAKVFKKLGLAYQTRTIPYPVAFMMAGVLEAIASLPFSTHEPKLTRYTAGVLAKSQTLDITKARELLGYKPRYSIDEGIDIYAKWWHTQHGN